MKTTLKKIPATDKCNARTRHNTYCGQWAGWGTSHSGEGRCKLHGGASPGAPLGNLNAVTTHEHRAIAWHEFSPRYRAKLIHDHYYRLTIPPELKARIGKQT
jgi:hypothetical protein